jgi:hypothetical protein
MVVWSEGWVKDSGGPRGGARVEGGVVIKDIRWAEGSEEVDLLLLFYLFEGFFFSSRGFNTALWR